MSIHSRRLEKKKAIANLLNMLDKKAQTVIPKAVFRACKALAQSGGQVWLVGGCVRDLCLDTTPKDWDIEVFGLEPQDLEAVLASLGHFELVGKQFGVYKLFLQGFELDIALPRKEIKMGEGHKGFMVTPDPNLSPEQASKRRDFTINAMMYNPLSEALLDLHGGQSDLQHKILKHVSSAFVEDPLRPLRAMQFAARFNFSLAQETTQMCQSTLSEAGSLPDARVWQEWRKWSLSDYPSMGLKALKDMGWDSLYPELVALQGCPQDTYWHPEGDVWVHTCLVVDEAARLVQERRLSEQETIILLFAALCHDLGKPVTTQILKNGKVVSPNHGRKGVAPSMALLERIGAPKWLKQHIEPLVREHVAHFSGKATSRAARRLAMRLEPSNIKLWEVLTEADACGRSPAPKSRPALAWLNKANALDVSLEKAKAIVTGKLLVQWGVSPSPQMGEYLSQAYDAQVQGLFHDETSAATWFEKSGIAKVEK